MTLLPIHINYLAVLVAAIVAFGLGALWYSPLLFAKRWVAAHGYSPEQVKEMQATAGPAYGVSFACFLVMAWVLSAFVSLTGAGGAMNGMKIGALAWLGFAFTIGLTANVYSNKRLATFIIDGGYQLLYLLIMGAILGAWR